MNRLAWVLLMLAGALGAQDITFIRDSSPTCLTIQVFAEDKARVEAERKQREAVKTAELRLVVMEKAIEALHAQVAALAAKLELKLSSK
jgi:hypothetical protein